MRVYINVRVYAGKSRGKVRAFRTYREKQV